MEKVNDIKKKHLFISVKPEFAEKIITKEKRIELRKVRPRVRIGDYVIIYASSPVKSVVGFGLVQQIIETTPEQMWIDNSSSLGIDKVRFDSYYNGRNRAIGIKIEKIQQITPLPLENLRNITPNFQPPQVYRYVSETEFCQIVIDKNQNIHICGNRQLIEQGRDEKGRYYKIYYKEEN